MRWETNKATDSQQVPHVHPASTTMVDINQLASGNGKAAEHQQQKAYQDQQ